MDRVFAIFGDIHGNLEAFQAVLEDARREGVTDYLCTGDIVGYGASPQECLDIVRKLQCPAVVGNHDFFASARLDLSGFNPSAARGVEWTRSKLSVGAMLFLRSLPLVRTVMGMALVHASLDVPENFGYVFDHLQAEAHFVHQVTPICFYGHTHCPHVFEKQLACVCPLEGEELILKPGRKYFINPGSVGQPRDGDPRSAYALYEPVSHRLRFRRLEYDIAAAQAKILAAGLPSRLAERLSIGR